MNQDVEKLVLLQAIDLERASLRAELTEAPRRVARAESERAAAESAVANAQAGLKKEEALRRGQESDIATHRGKIERLRRQMETATSAAQIAALEHEIQFAESAVAKCEDEEFASLERTEQLEADLAAAHTRLERTAANLATERERAAQTTATHTAALRERESERERLRAGIGEAALSHYDRVSKNRGAGVSEALDHKCSACQMMVRPQRWNDLTGREHDHELFTCETCGRILFWDPRRDKPGAWPPGERLATAKQHEARA